MKKPFFIAGLIGLAAVVAALFVSRPLAGYTFQCPPGFTRPVVALEFIASEQELITFFGPSALAGEDGEMTLTDEKNAIRRSLGLDFMFIPLYTLYLMAFAWAIYRQNRKKGYLLLILLAALIGLADIFENGAIQMLLNKFMPPAHNLEVADFQRLHFFAWTKWLGLVLYFAAVLPFLRLAGRLGQLLTLAAVVVCCSGLWAFFHKDWIEQFTVSVFLFFPLAVVFCFFYKSTPPIQETGGSVS